MNQGPARIGDFLKRICSKEVFACSLLTTMLVCYFISPLGGTGLTSWDRTFSTAMMQGISIDKRVGNFYFLLITIAVIFIISVLIYGVLCDFRKSYTRTFLKFNIVFMVPTAVSYLSRFSEKATLRSNDIFILSAVACLVLLIVICICDFSESLDFKDHVAVAIGFYVFVITLKILIGTSFLTSVCIAETVFIIYSVFTANFEWGKKHKASTKKFIYFLMWIPAVAGLVLEAVYILTRRGADVSGYRFIILFCVFLFMATGLAIIFLTAKSSKDFATFGYIGAIASICIIAYMRFSYAGEWSITDYSQIYEMGNSVGVYETLTSGSMPVAEYFSAHALMDVGAKILYGFFNASPDWIFSSPYIFISRLVALIAVYLITGRILDKEDALLFTLFFPLFFGFVKISSFCLLSMVMLVFVIAKPVVKRFIPYWLVLLLSAFVSYDEGIYLGIGSIVAFILLSVCEREIKRLGKFILTGAAVGIGAVVFYAVYCASNGIAVAGRFKEWISLSMGSNSTWATASFGDPSTIEFLVSYFVVPAVALVILGASAYMYCRTKKHAPLAALTMGFAIAQLMFISRGLVYHNLYVTGGASGVLLNYTHWTIALFTLYAVTILGRDGAKRTFTWFFTFAAVLILEIAFVGGVYPDRSSVLYTRAMGMSDKWDLSTDISGYIGQERETFDSQTKALIGQFSTIFDTLLTEEETFIDFANVTSLYTLTGRKLPSYVTQTPSMLTDLYTQECYIEQVSGYDAPLAVIGKSTAPFLQAMAGIPHNIRYYKVAEYIYDKYRPLIAFGDFAIWCDKGAYELYKEKLAAIDPESGGYEPIDYGYDAQISGHGFDLEGIPFIWANYDSKAASNNPALTELVQTEPNVFAFEGSQYFNNDTGNYILLECTNSAEASLSATVVFSDSSNENIHYDYAFTAEPGTNNYLFRVSQDYFWEAFNIDTVRLLAGAEIQAGKAKVLQGD